VVSLELKLISLENMCVRNGWKYCFLHLKGRHKLLSPSVWVPYLFSGNFLGNDRRTRFNVLRGTTAPVAGPHLVKLSWLAWDCPEKVINPRFVGN
jgi:hypothetical protein